MSTSMSVSVSAAASSFLPPLARRRSPPAFRVPFRTLWSLPRLLSSARTLLRPAAAMSTDGAAPAASSKRDLLIFDTEEDLAESLAKYTAELSEKFAAERGAFTVVVSGGSLIKALRKLAEPPYLETVDWSKWHVLWVDERVVPKDHADNNYKLAYDGLLSKRGVKDARRRVPDRRWDDNWDNNSDCYG